MSMFHVVFVTISGELFISSMETCPANGSRLNRTLSAGIFSQSQLAAVMSDGSARRVDSTAARRKGAMLAVVEDCQTVTGAAARCGR